MTIAVGLSGGVDSSVAALLLKQQGYDIFGLFMQNWNDSSVTLHGDCTWEDDLNLAMMTAKKLDIPFHFVDLSATYKQRVVDYMFSEYEHGRTPNPDVLCNREIKFDAFLHHAQELGADMVATGHYCRRAVVGDDTFGTQPDILSKHLTTNDNSHIYNLLAGSDPNKDQSYFLCQLNQEQLSKAIFPIGDIVKPEVRRLAAEAGLPTADRKDSQGICFVGKVDLPVFLQQQLKPKDGNVVEIFRDFKLYKRHNLTTEEAISFADSLLSQGRVDELAEYLAKTCRPIFYNQKDGKVIGMHQGAWFYTIGQRKGLNIGGHAEPLFVLSTDIQENVVYMGEGQDHPGLHRIGLFVQENEIHTIRKEMALKAGERMEAMVRIRYRQPLQQAVLYKVEHGLFILFKQYQRGITPGQFAAWYIDNELVGSGVIDR